MEEYILFCDETKKTKNNDYFVFGGIAFKRKDYIKDVIPSINQLKHKYFNTTDVVLHYTDIKKNKGTFKTLTDSVKRNTFYQEFKNIIKNIDGTTFVIYYHQDMMQSVYNKKTDGHYNIGFIKLLENYLHFLVENNGYGNIVVESRTAHENSMLLDTYYSYKTNGSVYFKPDIISKYVSSLGFVIKEDNCIGLQIADFIPASICRVINHQSDKQLLGQTFQNKIYKRGTALENIVGLKNLL